MTKRQPRRTLQSHGVTLSSILSKGYFPRELPPTFYTAKYARYAKKEGPSWPIGRWTRCVQHSLARPGGLRRPLKIPNPLSFFTIANIISTNWLEIRAHTWKERLSASRPYVQRSASRAVISRYHYGERKRLRALRRRSCRYLLVTDIDQFYPTIYTHTIPWALHTKKVSKAALGSKKSKKSGQMRLGDEIDKALQWMNEGQTQGIPIGPDTSLVVAEILLAAVDGLLLKSKSTDFRGFRYVDDYELCFQNMSAAEETLAELETTLASFELRLNPRKTRIVDLPCELETIWSSELRSIDIRTKRRSTGQRNDILRFFSRAFDLAATFPSESVLRYAISSVQHVDVSADGWRTFHNCVLGAASSDPSSLSVALGTLYQVATVGGHTVPAGPLAEVLENVIAGHAARAHSSEVAWAVWGALAWDVPLSSSSARLVSEMEDDIVALLALHAEKRGLFPKGSLDKGRWAEIVSQADVLDSEHWLLAYEADQKGWLSVPAVAKYKEFSAMSVARVSFYRSPGGRPQFPLAAKRQPGGGLWPGYA